MKIKKCYVVLLALGSFVGYKWYQHYQWQQLMLSGYCEKDGTYFDDRHTKQEVIDKAILYVIENQPDELSQFASQGNGRWDIKKYTTIEEFKKINPNCCRVDSWPDDAVREDYDLQLKGKAYKYVKVKYFRYYIANRKPEIWDNYIVFDNCYNIKERHQLY